MLERGKYTTHNGKTAMIYKDADTIVIANVLTVGFVAYNPDGTPAYKHIPQELTLNLDSRQDIPAWKGLITHI